MTGIALTDARLARHPRHALFWTLGAPFLYPALVVFFAAQISPVVADAFKADTIEGTQVRWVTLVLSATLVLGHMMHWANKVTSTPFALDVRSSARWALYGLLGGPLLTLVLATALGWFFEPGAIHKNVPEASQLTGQAIAGFGFLYIVVLKPLIEEIGFRGIAFGALKGRGAPDVWTVGVTAFGFSLIHIFQYSIVGLFSVFVLGLFLGWLRYASKSIGPPILAHMAVNLYGVMTLWGSAS